MAFRPSEAFRPAPMEAKLVESLPTEKGWQFEPKWDGFRALAFRDGSCVDLRSKSGKDLGRYFPEVVELLASLSEMNFALDGELIIPIDDVLSFDALQQRLHPAASRIEKLSKATPAKFMLFDCLAVGNKQLYAHPLTDRRAELERFHAIHGGVSLLLSPCTRDAPQAGNWLMRAGGALDGVIAKRLDEPYRPGERAMLKVKQVRSADCVVGGFRHDKEGKGVGSLLLGLYNDAGELDHVGFTSAMKSSERIKLIKLINPISGGPGFTGKRPDGASRWNNGESSKWIPLHPDLVVEVLYDQVTGNRFRHGTRLLRWRPDKAARQCTMAQLKMELRPAELTSLGVKSP
ncbi:MAG: ATP-dependent DNA ligase [Sphingobium sp.]|uniref:ATP-dependent DNA ligase n=1 Tax=Sphingobium sp. TaxID=1912891 RepID=UPI0029B8A50D|nr:ATP-dependent DNA ligase [Sphingobium sp.]MDX3910506.1 ATP-dependent DNA ligase [Sphingobium sp.]